MRRLVVGLMVVSVVVLWAFPVSASHDGRWHVEERASVTEDGDPAPWSSHSVGISADGEMVAFGGEVPFFDESTGDPRPRLYKVGSNKTMTVPADQGAECWNQGVQISADGRFLLFGAQERLVPADTNDVCDIYVYDRVTGGFDGMMIGEDQAFAPRTISGDGQLVAIANPDPIADYELVVLDRVTGEEVALPDNAPGFVANPWLSEEGRYIAYSAVRPDSDGFVDVVDVGDVAFVDLITGETERLAGYVIERTDPEHPERLWRAWSWVFSENRRFLAYATEVYTDWEEWDPTLPIGMTLVIHDRDNATNTEITITYDDLENLIPGPTYADLRPFFISNSGESVYFGARAGGAFTSPPPPAHLFELDRSTHPESNVDIADLEMIDVNLDGKPGDDDVQLVRPAASTDGSVVAFLSEAGNLMPGEINNERPGFNIPDVFVARRSIFSDTTDSIFENAIERLAAAGITKGCNPPDNDKFCPDDDVTRGQMAVFLARAFDYTDDGGGDLFVDDDGEFYETAADRIKTAGVTFGCNPPDNDRYCGEDFVTRGQMAAFLVRALGLTDDGGGDLFTDDDDSTFETAIDRLGTAGITKGCNPPDNDEFCPDDRVTRGQMAAFLVRAGLAD